MLSGGANVSKREIMIAGPADRTEVCFLCEVTVLDSTQFLICFVSAAVDVNRQVSKWVCLMLWVEDNDLSHVLVEFQHVAAYPPSHTTETCFQKDGLSQLSDGLIAI